VYLAVLAWGGDAQQVVNVVGHKLEVRLLRELVGFRRGKVVVGERSIESRDEREERLPVDGVAQGGAGLVLGAGAAGEGPGVAVPRRHGVRVAPVSILRRRQGLQCAWGASVFSSKLLVQLLLCCNHFTGIALNPSNYTSISGLHEQVLIKTLKRIVLQQLHVNDEAQMIGLIVQSYVGFSSKSVLSSFLQFTTKKLCIFLSNI